MMQRGGSTEKGIETWYPRQCGVLVPFLGGRGDRKKKNKAKQNKKPEKIRANVLPDFKKEQE